MESHYMNYEDLVRFEKERRLKTNKAHKPIEETFINMVNYLFAASYNFGELVADKNNWLYNIQDLSRTYFMETAYNIRSIQILLEIGNYGQAGTILRVMLDTFVPLRYYTNIASGKKYSKYVLRESSTRLIDLYEKLSPNFYEHQYSGLCNFAHGNPITSLIMRRKSKLQSNTETNYTSSDINMDWYSIIWNQTIHLYKGIMILFEDIFPNNTLTEKKYLDMKKALEEFINGDIEYRTKMYSKQIEMIEEYNKLIK